MNYSFITAEQLQSVYEKEKDSFPASVHPNWVNNPNIVEVYSYICKSDEGKILGLCVGVVYKNGTMGRTSQWNFGENMHMELWIDHIHTDSNSECRGSYLLEKVEEKLRQHVDRVERKNIYVVSIFDAISFYEKKGYIEIITNDHEEDDDYPSSFVDGACIGTWMCKPLLGNLDCEETARFLPEYCFGNSSSRNSITILRNYLNFEADETLLYFLGSATSFDLFKERYGRKYLRYTEEEFRNKFYPKYSDFLTALESIKGITHFGELNLTSHPIVPFFKNMSLGTLQECLENYVDMFC
jgi:hypothetical protein